MAREPTTQSQRKDYFLARMHAVCHLSTSRTQNLPLIYRNHHSINFNPSLHDQRGIWCQSSWSYELISSLPCQHFSKYLMEKRILFFSSLWNKVPMWVGIRSSAQVRVTFF